MVEWKRFHLQSLGCLQSSVWWSSHYTTIYWLDNYIISKKLFRMSVETKWMRPICLLAYQDGVEVWYEGWTLQAIEGYYPFWQEFFSHTHAKLAASYEAPFFSVNRNKGFVFIILLPELNGLVRWKVCNVLSCW